MKIKINILHISTSVQNTSYQESLGWMSCINMMYTLSCVGCVLFLSFSFGYICTTDARCDVIY